MNRTILVFISVIIVLVVNVNAQNTVLPNEFVGYYSIYPGSVSGNVHTILTVSYRNGQLLGDIFVETFDSRQRRIEKISHSGGIETHSKQMVNLSNKIIYFYKDLETNPYKNSVFESDGTPGNSILFKYDLNGNLIKELVYDKQNTLRKDSKYIYDDDKRIISNLSKSYFGERSITQKIILELNDKKQVIKKIYYEDNKINNETLYEYNSKGFITKQKFCCEQIFFHTYEYETDKHGNWIKRIEYYSQKNESGNWDVSESMRTYRVITYFDDLLDKKSSESK